MIWFKFMKFMFALTDNMYISYLISFAFLFVLKIKKTHLNLIKVKKYGGV